MSKQIREAQDVFLIGDGAFIGATANIGAGKHNMRMTATFILNGRLAHIISLRLGRGRKSGTKTEFNNRRMRALGEKEARTGVCRLFYGLYLVPNEWNLSLWNSFLDDPVLQFCYV